MNQKGRTMNIAVIGYGHMAGAIVRGWIQSEVFRPEEIFVCAHRYEPLKKRAREMGINPCKTAEEAVRKADWILYGGPADRWETILLPLAQDLEGKVLLSIAAGVPFEDYESTPLSKTHHLSLLPSLPVEVQEGVVLAENRSSLTEPEKAKAETLLKALGLFEEVDSSMISAAGTLTGCGPAFVYAFMEALSDAIVRYGIKRDQSYRLITQMVLGSAALQKETGVHPTVLKEAVASPGGTTIRGLNALHKTGFSRALIEGMEAILKEEPIG